MKAGAPEAYDGFLVKNRARRPAGPRDLLDFRSQAPRASRRSRAGRDDSAAIRLLGDVARRALARGTRDALGRDEPYGRPLQLGRRRRGSATLPRLRERRPRRQPYQAGGVGAIRSDNRISDCVPKSSRSRSCRVPSPAKAVSCPAHKVTELIARLRHAVPGHSADLAATASRHLFDRGPGAAHPRSQDGEPARSRGRQAGRGERRGHRGGGRGEGVCRLRADRRAQRRHRRIAAQLDQARRLALGAGAGGGPDDPGSKRIAPSDRGADRRWTQDRSRRGDRGVARGGELRLRHRAAGGDGMRDGPAVPHQHLSHRHRDAA